MPVLNPVLHNVLNPVLHGLFAPNWAGGVLPGRIFFAPIDNVSNGIDAKEAAGSPTGTFVRASANRSFVDPVTGLIAYVGANVMAFESNGSKFEGQRANDCLQSQAFDVGATWTNFVGTPVVTANTDVAPDGTTTADKIADDAAGAREELGQSVGLTDDGSIWVWTFYLKKMATTPTEFPLFGLSIQGGTLQNIFFWVNELTGATEQEAKTGTASFSVESFNDDWWRVICSVTGNGTNTSASLNIYPSYGTTFGTPNDAAQGNIVLWGSKLEKGDFDSSDILTTIAAVTRDQDTLTWEAASNILTAQGTIVLTPTVLNAAQAMTFLDTRNGSNQQGVHIGMNASGQAVATVTTAIDQANLTATGDDFVAGTPKQVALTWQANEFKLITSGVERVEDTAGSVPASHTIIRAGALGDNTVPLFGNLENLHIFNQVHSAAEIATL